MVARRSFEGGVALGEIWRGLVLPIGIGIVHAGARVDVLADVVVVAHSAHPLDDRPRQHQAVVAVGKARPRFERRRALAVKGDVVFVGLELFEVGAELGVEDVAGAAGMCEQMMGRHLLRHVGVRVVRDVLADGVCELELAMSRELRHRNGGEHLVHRAEVVFGVKAAGNLLLPVLHAADVTEHRFALAGDQHAAGEPLLPHQLVDTTLESLERLFLGHPRQRELGGGRPRVHNRHPKAYSSNLIDFIISLKSCF